MASFVFLSAALGAVVTATAPAARPTAADPSPRSSSVKIYRALSTDACEALAASLTEANAQQNGTRWLSAETTPATPLERAVRAVFDLHTSNLGYDAAISGAEYWVQSHVEAGDAPSNGIALHRDFDLGVLEEDGRGGDVEAALPNVSTITYLTSSENSMPTLIFTDFEIATAAGGAWGVAKEAWAIYPRAGKHVCFDGALWHGVPPAVVYGGPVPARVGVPGARRVTLLVNVWLDRVPRKALAPRAGAAAFGAVDVPPLEFAAEDASAVEHWAAQAGPSWQRAGDADVEAGALALPLFAEVEVEDGAPPTRELGVKLWLPPALVRGPRGAGASRVDFGDGGQPLAYTELAAALRASDAIGKAAAADDPAAVALLRAAESGAADFELAGKLLTRGASVGEVAALLLSG